jgi:beta-glucanase (GH16 family)
MSKTIIFASVCVLVSVLIAAAGFITPVHATFSLVWSDEFNGTGLDAGNWVINIGDGCPDLCGWGNNELQYYRAENVTVSGGNLVLTTLAESYGGRSYTSGKVTTKDRHSFLYGRMEMRAKLPVGGGMWPAFWMMPQDDVYGGWAASGELDIMESSNDMTSIGGTIHYGGTYPSNTYSGGSYSLGGTSFADDFHIYAVEWEPDEMRWYVDGVLYSTKSSSEWYTNAAPGDEQAPFDQEFYIILNAAIGGNYTGCTNPGCITAALPQQFLVDYVRVYEDIPNATPAVSITSPASGSSLPAGDITIEATASDTDGSIATVEFYNGFTYLGEDTTEPYSFLWASVPGGCYEIVARAIDDLGGEETDAVDVTVGTGCGQAPFSGSPIVFPARVEAEDYDLGGEGVAYHDTDTGNNGGQYRLEDVDIEACSDTGGGFNVGWVSPNEWLEYTVTVPRAGDYTMEARVASLSGGGTFHVNFSGMDRTGDITVPVTGGWQSWTTVTVTATLSAGTQYMRFVPTADGFNINYFDIQIVSTDALPGIRESGFTLHPCYPNPFNPVTTIGYDLQSPAIVSLAVFDVAGRLVQTLVDAEATATGHHRVVWNGLNRTGRAVAAGVYFYRLDVGGHSETRRMILVK